MHGDGTKLDDILNSSPPARLLDITRLVRRAGRFLTGVDRVEMAYLTALVEQPVPLFGLVRTSFGYVLLDRSGLVEIKRRLCSEVPFGDADILSRFSRGLTPTQRKALSEVRRWGIARSTPRRFERMLAVNLPAKTSYINVGHSNLTERVLSGVKSSLNGRVSVLIHDVIPLDFPHFQRVGTVDAFEKKLRCVQRFADLIVYNSRDTQARAEKYLNFWGGAPDAIVAHLGTVATEIDSEFVLPNRPYFVSVSTIEPRKNYGFLLNLWTELGPNAPELHICGTRGWNNQAVFDRLDSNSENTQVFERGDLNDPELMALVAGSQGMLFPSLAEGFGLPPVEAAALGVPILCNDLEVLRETLGEIPVYAKVSDSYLWLETVKTLALSDPNMREAGRYIPPSWDDHFKIVLSLI